MKDEEILQLYKQGCDVKEIMAHGFSRSTIYRVLESRDICIRKERYRQNVQTIIDYHMNGLTVKEIADKTGKSITYVYSIINDEGEIPNKPVSIILKLHMEGLTVKEIADKTGHTTKSIYAYLYRVGESANNKNFDYYMEVRDFAKNHTKHETYLKYGKRGTDVVRRKGYQYKS